MSYTFQYAEVLELKKACAEHFPDHVHFHDVTAAEVSISRSTRRMTRCAGSSSGILRSAA